MIADIAVSGALSLVETVSSFINHELNLKTDVQSNIDCIMGWLRTMQSYLINAHGRATTTHPLLQDRVRQIRDYAYEIEDIIDHFMFHVPHHFHRNRSTQRFHNIWHHASQRNALRELSSRIEVIKKKIENLKDLNFLQYDNVHNNSNNTLCVGASSSITTTIVTDWTHHPQDELVGFRSLRNRIMNQLLSGESSRITLAVVGPSGSGKTAFMKNIYQDPCVWGQFQCQAWVSASPNSLTRKETLASIASQILGDDGEPSVDVRILQRHLQDKKFFIVLDDVWRKEDWKYIAEVLPHGFQGSRIVVTCCNNDVAASCVEYRSHVHQLEGLTWKEARNLFCKKAFPTTTNGECPLELEVFAENIVKKCEGLPLAITTVAGLISKKPLIPIEWKKFHDSLGTDLSVIRSILPSYDNLRSRSDIKSCFLYFGVFPEDYSIQRERLIRLWIAEGFIPKLRNRSLDEVAEDILKELVQRNLVHVSKSDVDGRVRSCRVLNLVREFIISVSEEEKFIRVIGDVSLKRDKVRRLSLLADGTVFSVFPGENLNHVRSAFVFGKKSSYNLNLFELLRVLDMQGSALDSFPKEIPRLSLLRYLSLQNTKIQLIPNSIKKLPLLETLDLKQTLITRLPTTISRLRNLRHLLVYRYEYSNYVPFDGAKGVEISSESIGDLTLLEKLSLVTVNTHIVKELGNLINLRKLGIVGLKETDGQIFCESLQKMARLSTLDVRSEVQDMFLDLDNVPDRPMFEFLQRLHLKGRLRKLPRWVSALQSLIKISLKWSRIQEKDPFKALENLPNLMELEMVDAYTEEDLEFRENTFRKLKLLHIEHLSQLNMVLVLEGTMPELEKLKICKCGNMKILPIGIEGLSHLEELLVYDMPEEFNNKLRYEDRAAVRHIGLIQSFDQHNNPLWSLHGTDPSRPYVS